MKHFELKKNINENDTGWSSVSDIGKTFDGKILNQEDYLTVEANFIEVLHSFLLNGKCGSFSVRRFADDRGLAWAGDRYFDIDNPLLKIRGGETLEVDTMLTLFRLCLREIMWIRLESESGCYINLGRDLCAYLGVADDARIDFELITTLGLILEKTDEDPWD